MKYLKNFSLILLFSLIICGVTLCNLTFMSPQQEKTCADESQNEVVVTQDNAEEVFLSPWQYSTITLGSDIDMSQIVLQSANSSNVFTGTFDGNGHIISNLSFEDKSNSSYIGLIPNAQNAVIKNVKIEGIVNFSFNEKNYSDLCVGLLVGKGVNIAVSNCEIKLSDSINLNYYSASSSFGFISGKVESSTFEDIVIYANLEAFLRNDLLYYFGGVAGAMSSSSFKRIVYFGDISLNAFDGVTIFNNSCAGGIIGFAEGGLSFIKDCCFSGQITSAFSMNGAIIGQISTNNTIDKSRINYCYWREDSSLNVIGKNGQNINETTYLKPVSSISYTFLTTKTNFNPVESGFDFKKIFGFENGKFVLQKFQLFEFSKASNLGENIESIIFNNDPTLQSLQNVAYGEKINILIQLKSKIKNGQEINNVVKFYKLSAIRVNGEIKDENQYQISINETSNSISIELYANGDNSGTYSFSFSPNSYRGEFTIKKDGDIIPGGVTFSGTNPVENIIQSYTIESSKTNINAVGQGYYTFDHWELYYYVDGSWQLQNNWAGNADITNPFLAGLPINFGVEPFDRAFKLEAVFSSENGIKVNFAGVNDSLISSLSLQGIDYEGSPITVLKTLTNASLVIVMKDGYELNLASFISSLSSLYNQNLTENEIVKRTGFNEKGLRTYTLNLNISKLAEKATSGTISLSLPIKYVDNSGDSNLLWLWITIPCLIIIIVAIILIIYFKKRNQARNNVRKKEKKINYKDFYS